MWTNVFRIGGLHHISWFQFLPHESDITPLDKSMRAEQRDAATSQVLSSHLQLQNEGFLSTWTNSFVGPWDPSQGLHNPDEKIKLWLFLPGCHSSVIESAQAAISRLRIVASGQWMAPGDSEEVATALSQALRNRIERALIGLSYVRFGDVFARYCPISQSEQLFRKGWPTIEFVFAATEDSIFVHVVVTAKLIRALSDGDMERVLKLSSNGCGGKLPVIVSPHGMRGRLTGCCPSDLVKQVYIRSGNLSTSTGLVGLPYPLSQASGCKLRGQSCYAEVMLGYATSGSEKEKQSNFIAKGNFPNSVAGDVKKGCADDTPVCEKTFIYPREAVIVPVLQTSYAKSSLKRFWLQNWMGPSLASSTIFTHCCPSELDAMGGSCTEPNGIRSQHGDNSSSNSNNSSISSINSSSSESDSKVKTTASELEADADSISCRQSGLSSVDPTQRNGSKQGAKRPRTGMEESFGQVGTSIQDAYKSDFNNPTITGLANDQMGSLWPWDWDDDDGGVGMDIQALLSEFGGFGDFFENDALPFGEPPGTAESQALIFSGPEFGDVAGVTSGGIMEVSDQMPLPVTFPAFEIFNPTPTGMEECVSAVQEATKSTSSSAPGSYILAASAVEFDQVTKAEALMTFASEYGAVETPSSEVSSTIFRSPYLPKSRKVPSNSSGTSYVYGVTPPSSPHLVASDEKPGMSVDSSLCSVKGDVGVIVQSKKFYTHVESGKEPLDRKSVRYNNSAASCEGTAPSFSGFNPTNAVKSVQNKTTEVTFHAEDLLLSRKTIPAAELDCLIFQASMCRIRHTLLSSGNPASITWIRSAGSTVLSQLPGDPSNMTDNVHSKYEVKKKDSIPVRIAGDIDRRMLDGPLSAPVGVWRSVGEPKCAKPVNTPTTEVFPSSSHNEENTILYGQRQPLQDLLDGLPLLVQQAASFVDVALDAECTDGPYGWLALQEQWRRGFCCGPHLVHAGCGGTLASGHSLDIAGVELVDPLSADVHASSVISYLQSDMKTALKSVFSTLDGPLPVMDWCKGCCQSGDAGAVGDGFSAESSLSECTTTPSMGDPASPLQSSAGVASSIKDGAKGDDSQRRLSQEFCVAETEQQLGSQRRPSVFVVPYPSVLVGYQDDWLKTSPSSIQLWEKAPFEPYALPKHMIYSVVCPNIEPLISAARDFFQQLGTVYETCKLGGHSPQSLENQMEVDSGKFPSSGFVLLDCPQAMKIETTQASLVGSISDYFLSLSNGWDMNSFLKSLKKVLKALKFGSPSSMHTKEGNNSPSTVIYVVCPFPDPCAILQTLIESSVTVGSVIFSADSDRRSMLHNQVCKALSYSAGVDEASASNILALSGFNIPKLVLQVITVDAIFRVTSPTLSEPVLLKDIAFTVYNKARRISRGFCNDVVQSGRSHPVMMQMPNSIPGMWKECVAPRISCASVPRESDIDSGLRAGTWDSTWQTSRSGTLICDPNRGGDFQEEVHYMFEPLFILAEPGSMEHGVSPTFTGNGGMESTRQLSDDSSTGSFIQSCASAVSGDTGPGSQLEGPETDGCGSGLRKSPPTLHCCYGWTEDWHWLVCIWTDSRGELLDSNIFPFGGTSSRQDTKGMQSLFVQVLQQGCQILQACSSPDTFARARDFVITRIGCFYELECQEWQKALYSIGGSEVKKWPMQLRRAVPVGISTSSNGPSLQQQEMERSLPSSPSPLYSPPAKSSGFMKAGLGQPTSRKQLGGPAVADGSRGLLQWVQSISFVAISIDHTLQLVLQADSSPGGTQVGVMGASSSYLEGYTPVRSLGSVSASYILIPSPSMRFLSPTPLQLPFCLTAESPPLAHLLHSRGSAIPLATGFVVSKAVPSLKKDASRKVKEEWPSVLSVSLIDYYGGYASNEKPVKGISKHGGRASISEARDYEIDTHLILESIAAELHALSWMTVSPAYLERRTALPFHCDMVLRLRRLLHFAEKQISPERK